MYIATAVMLAALVAAQSASAQTASEWKRNDPDRPIPHQVENAGPVTIPPPGDAIILFDGADLSAFRLDPQYGWTVSDGTLVAGGRIRNYLETRQHFGDLQIHLEFMTPYPPQGEGQKRGNSGVFLLGAYEIQIMDPAGNPTFADGLPGSIYGQTPPSVLAARKPGEWQSYDIVFHAPDFDGEELLSPPTVTVLHNGVLVQDQTVVRGDTIPRVQPPEYQTRIERGPLVLQDHGDAGGRVRFRNIWVRPLDRPTEDDG